jgi:hypothetical protein
MMKPDPRIQEYARKYSQIVAKAWDDEAFKQRLLTSPADVLTEHGIEVPAGASVRVAEEVGSPDFRDGVISLPLPPKPTSAELSDEQLEGVAGGVGLGSFGSCQGSYCNAWAEPADLTRPRVAEGGAVVSNPLLDTKKL